MSSGGKGSELRAGLFVMAGLAVLVGGIFLLGQKSSLFTRNARLYVSFADISGLVVGAPVRLAGMDVGTVTGIAFPDDLTKSQAKVSLAVQSKFMPRVRADSLAFIDSNGLLGDKIVNISMGDPATPQLKDGDTIKTGETLTFEAISAAIHDAIISVRGVSEGLNSLVGDIQKNDVTSDITAITRSMAGILKEVESGEGLAHRLIYDRRYAEHFSAILAQTRSFTSVMSRAVGRVDNILAEVEKGDGTLHEVIYGNGGKKAIEQLELAAREIEDVTREIREGEGLIHTLVYDEGNTNFLRELNEVAVTVNKLTDEIDKGRGTVGGLLKDPTVYEDLKTVLGNVKRNVLFKSLVRFTIEQDGLRQSENAPAVALEDDAAKSVDGATSPASVDAPQGEAPIENVNGSADESSPDADATAAEKPSPPTP